MGNPRSDERGYTFMSDRKNPPAVSGRVVAGALIVAALAVLASFNSYLVSVANADRFPDPYAVALAETRFAPALPQLPPSAALAYVSDLPVGELAGTTAFLAAQYALAPRMLVVAEGRPTADWAVGNFSRPSPYAPVGARFGFAMVSDQGNGVIVYKKRAKP
jgi:hypothetical protein